MKHLRPVLAAVLIVVVLLSSASPVLGASPNAQVPASTVRVWINYSPGKGAQVQQMLTNSSARFHYSFDNLNAHVVTIPTTAFRSLGSNTGVTSVEIDAERYPIADMQSVVSAEALAYADVTAQTVPYGVDMVQARDVWDANRDGVIDSGAPSGAGRKVCIIDTGYQQSHEDLPDATGGHSQVDTDWTVDGYGHGTHVGGTIAAENNGYGVVGVTPGTVELFVVKVFSDSGQWVTSSDLVDALNRCVAAGANVVNMSLGSNFYVANENRAFSDAFANGVLSIAAAGNRGGTGYSYPASYSSVVSVAAIDSSKTHASFSQSNNQVELAAPGVGVLSTVRPSGYQSWSGTSMATPHVAAVAALVWSANPAWSAAQIREALQASAEDLGAPGRDDSYGYGLVRARSALDWLGYQWSAPENPPANPPDNPPDADPPSDPPNSPPTTQIENPDDEASYQQGSPITFTASAIDPEEGDLSSQLVWRAGDTLLHTGPVFETDALPIGTHVITAVAEDTYSAAGTDSVTVIITAKPTAVEQIESWVFTDKEVYTDREQVEISVWVTDQDTLPVEGARVAVIVSGPDGRPKKLEGVTNGEGLASFTYRASTRKMGSGTYTVTAVASAEECVGYESTTTFVTQ